MKTETEATSRTQSRRRFLEHSGKAMGASALLASLPRGVHAGEHNTIKVALVGCGGRGTGAAVNALSTKGPTRLVAMADLFDRQIDRSLENVSRRFEKQVDVPRERRFLGMDAYRHAIDAVSPRGVVIFATPPAFRPYHVEYAVSRNCHVFMEKSFAVDVPGALRVLAAGKEAERKGLKIAGGLMSRHSPPLEEAVRRIHDGAIGEIITCWAYRMHGPVGFKPRPSGMSELGHQIRNYSCFTWLNGSFMLDWLIHNLDVCCWVKNGWPVSAQGQGGRQARREPDQMFDHFAVEYSFDDGTRLMAQGRHMDKCWGFFGDVIHGTKGSAVLGEGIRQPRLFKGHSQRREDTIWSFKGPSPSAYQIEHDRLFAAIREDRPYNESKRSVEAALVGIVGRMAAESGQVITRPNALASKIELAPGLESFTMDSEPPVRPDERGRYRIAIPGTTIMRS